MINLTSQGDTTEHGLYSLVADTEEDVPNLITQYADAKMGSTCFVISTGSVYMKNSEGQWKSIG